MVAMDYLRLTRWKNVLMVLATQAFTLFFVIKPFLSYTALFSVQNAIVFLAIGLASVFISAGGYVINDYYDVDIDKANRVTVIVGESIPQLYAFRFYLTLTVMGVLAGIAAGVILKNTLFIGSFLVVVFLLWSYSRSLKKIFPWGNLLVALLSAYPVLIMYWAASLIYPESLKADGSWLMMKYFVLGYGFFAFAVHFLREIIKDAEDYSGDSAFGARTLPLLAGKKRTVHVCLALSAAIMLSLLYAQVLLLSQDFIFISGYLLIVQVLFIGLLMKLRIAQNPEDFHKASVDAKYIMLAGISSMILIPIVL